jgi:serine phosphatase RsbU (regulator of sigma subunit)/CHASE2 domain-containing sensor protein
MKKHFDVYGVLSISVIALFFLFLSYSRIFDDFEYSALDLRYMLRPIQPVDNKIAIIHIDDNTIDQLGEWPIPRKYHALLIKALSSAGVRSVVVDVFFSERTEDDGTLVEEVRKAGNIYLPYVLEMAPRKKGDPVPKASGYIAPLIEPLQGTAKGTGYINVEPDYDGKVRHVMPFVQMDGKYYPHITVLAALEDLGIPFETVNVRPGERMVVGDLVIPIEENSSILVNYPGEWAKTFRHYSYIDIIQSYLADTVGQRPAVDLKELKDAVCYVGFTASASPDAHPSPLEPVYPGVGVHTSIYNSIMKRAFLTRVDRFSNILVLIVLWIMTAIVTLKSHRKYAFFYVIGMIIAYAAMSILVFTIAGIWIDMFYPLVTMVGIYAVLTFRKYLDETKKRELLEKELDIAKDIQQSFLPKEIPEVGDFNISVKMRTARQVGGDLYDIIDLGDEKLGVMMGDVSGKGVPAALFMAKVVSVFKSFVREGAVNEIMKNVNDRLSIESANNLFVTMTYMVIDGNAGKAETSIGGHLPTIVISPKGDVRLIETSEGIPLGLMESDFAKDEVVFEKGSTFILYTDGVTEAMDPRGEMFGQERLVELAKTFASRTPEELVEIIHKRIAEFEAGEQHDDITVIVVRC